MSRDIGQVFIDNPISIVLDTMLVYLNATPHTATGNNGAALASVLKAYAKGAVTNAGNPNTVIAGALADMVWDTTNGILWICTTAGIAAAAVWTQATFSLLSGVAVAPGSLRSFRPLGPNTYTGTTYTFALTDANTFIGASNAAAQTFTVPLNATAAFPVGTEIELAQLGAGKLTIAATGGVTINPAATLSAANQYAVMRLKKIATDTWILSGSIGA
jgi:hypothetical protein